MWPEPMLIPGAYWARDPPSTTSWSARNTPLKKKSVLRHRLGNIHPGITEFGVCAVSAACVVRYVLYVCQHG